MVGSLLEGLEGSKERVGSIVEQVIDMPVDLLGLVVLFEDAVAGLLKVEVDDLAAGVGDFVGSLFGFGGVADGANDAVAGLEGAEGEELAHAVGDACDEPDRRRGRHFGCVGSTLCAGFWLLLMYLLLELRWW